MSELRQNIISNEWVIIAPERAGMARDYPLLQKAPSGVSSLERKNECPFCPGNESMTAPEIFCLGAGKGWKLRVIHNKFPVLSPSVGKKRTVNGVFHSMSGFGMHEVVVESPRHNASAVNMSEEEYGNIIRAYKSRCEALRRDKNIETVTIFKNHGVSAGTSIEHPHSQIIATPMVPPQTRKRMEQAAEYFDNNGVCVFCRMLEEELKARERIIAETERFAAFVPYAALSPYHVWIFPKKHTYCFSAIDEAQIRDFAVILKKILSKIYHGLCNPDYNYTIRSFPGDERSAAYFHWYMSIIPRLGYTAGFEMGSGVFINTDFPEKNAEFLRSAGI